MNLEKVVGWNQAPLENLLDYYIGGDWGKDPDFEDKGYALAYCIRGSEIRNWNEDKGKTASLRKIKKGNIEKRELIEGDILVEISGGGPEQPVGRTVLIEKRTLNFDPSIPKICTNFLRLIRPNSLINSRYLNLYLNLFYNSGEIIMLQNGSNNLRNLKFPEFLKLEIPYPAYIQQNKIVEKIEELFSELDKGIENLKTAQEQLKVYRQAVLKWAFEGKLTNENVKDGELPEGWTFDTLGQHISVIDSGKSYKCEERPPQNNELGIIKVSSVTWGDFDEVESKTCFNDDLFNPKYLINTGDFLFSRANTLELVGACVIVKNIHKKLMLSDKILRLNFTNDLNKHYALYYLRSKLGKRQITNLSTGNQESMRNIGQEKIKQIIFPYCQIQEQETVIQQIESRLSVCDKIEETITTSLQQAEALRQSILKKAFEGKLVAVVKQPEEAKVIAIDNRDCWQRKVLAGHIIYAFQKGGYVGRTKFQKILYLCEQHAQLDFDTHYVKEAAGPLDSKFLYAFLNEGKQKNWIEETPVGNGFKYEPSTAISELTIDYPKYFRSSSDNIGFVIKLLKDTDTDTAELIATVYAVWNNYIIKKQKLDETLLIKEVYEWDDSKIKFNKSLISSTWQWMKEVELIPIGFGTVIDKRA